MTALSPTLDLAPDVGFAAFVATHQIRLRRYALALTGNSHDADDLLQTTLVKVYLAWDRIDGRDNLAAYARTTMARSYVSAWRRWGRRESPTDSPPDVPVPSADTTADRDLIWRGLARLGRRQRAVVVLRYFEDLDLAAIGDELGISTGTVKSQLSRALSNLRDYLGDDES
ncbi:MAG: SigE family RNA polymerase sigma factor [Actinobacteria bacterium]|nr:SigE family RNA polymerase sigma factor [Actinomycetota bacterium]